MAYEPGDTVILQFSAFEDDGLTKKTGLTAPDVTLSWWRDAVVVSPVATFSEIGTSGEYRLSFPVDAVGRWKIEILVEFSGEILAEEFDVVTLADLTELQADLSTVRALLQENALIDNHVFDPDGQLLSARIRVFNTPAKVPLHGGGTETDGLTHTFLLESHYDGVNKLKTFAKRVSN